MTKDTTPYVVVFPDWYDERAEFEHSAKGFLPDVEVRFADGTRHRLYFYDAIRLGQDLEEEVKLGRPFLSEPGLVIVPEVTRTSILKAVAGLWQRDFFSRVPSSNGN
jgi:hypothetical protein